MKTKRIRHTLETRKLARKIYDMEVRVKYHKKKIKDITSEIDKTQKKINFKIKCLSKK